MILDSYVGWKGVGTLIIKATDGTTYCHLCVSSLYVLSLQGIVFCD